MRTGQSETALIDRPRQTATSVDTPPAVLRSAPAASFIDRLESTDQDALRHLGREINAPAGAVMMFEGEPADRVMILSSGRVKLTRLGPSGRETLLAFRGPGDLIGELALIDAERAFETVTRSSP